MRKNFIEEYFALESLDGQTSVEKEITFYLRLNDFSELVKADRFERQEQWEFKLYTSFEAEQPAAAYRVRKTESEGVPVYSQAIKVRREDGARDENEIEISAQLFDLVASTAERGMTKKRYFFNIPNTNLVWEMDVYEIEPGRYANWVRLELENPPARVPDFPIRYEEVIAGDSNDPEDKALIKELYEKIFVTKK